MDKSESFIVIDDTRERFSRIRSMRSKSRFFNFMKPPELPPVEPLEKRLTEAFDVFDNERNGEVDVRDLGTIIRALGCVITEAELQEIQVEMEDVENNCVERNRFVEYMRKALSERKFKPADPEELLQAFKLLDPENNGYVMRSVLEKAMMEIGEPFTEEEINEMMSIACDPKTGRINYEHYINLLIVKITDDKNVYKIYEKLESVKSQPVTKMLNFGKIYWIK